VMNISVSTCLPANISHKPHVQTLPNFLLMLPMAVAQSTLQHVSAGDGVNMHELQFNIQTKITSRWLLLLNLKLDHIMIDRQVK